MFVVERFAEIFNRADKQGAEMRIEENCASEALSSKYCRKMFAIFRKRHTFPIGYTCKSLKLQGK
jgi:hypothetical protein